jgi:pectin lyase
MIVQVSGTIDLTNANGTTTSSVCYQSQCSNGQYEYISNGLGACESAGTSTFNYTYDAAGVNPLLINSDKTLIGIGPNATIAGKGLKLVSGVSNVIIRNLTITNINPELIWGGDAIDLSGATKVWIDHNRISLVGRQFLVSHYDPNTNVTVSFNDFDGSTTYSATCNGAHYWDMLLLGGGDTMTIADNWIHHMSGRSPHAGGYSTANVKVHMVNDFHQTIPGHACDAGLGGYLLYEGSYFQDVTTPFTTNTDGAAYAPLSTTVSSTSSACQTALGRTCVANYANSGTSTFRLDASGLTAFSSLSSSMVKPYPASEVPNCVPHLAGPGHI